MQRSVDTGAWGGGRCRRNGGWGGTGFVIKVTRRSVLKSGSNVFKLFFFSFGLRNSLKSTRVTLGAINMDVMEFLTSSGIRYVCIPQLPTELVSRIAAFLICDYL